MTFCQFTSTVPLKREGSDVRTTYIRVRYSAESARARPTTCRRGRSQCRQQRCARIGDTLDDELLDDAAVLGRVGRAPGRPALPTGQRSTDTRYFGPVDSHGRTLLLVTAERNRKMRNGRCATGEGGRDPCACCRNHPRRLFTEKGYFATGTTEIVELAGVGTRGALYHHFENKQALFLAVFEEIEVDLGARSVGAITGNTWLERLDQALAAFLDASLEPEVRRVLLIDGPRCSAGTHGGEIEAATALGAIQAHGGRGRERGEHRRGGRGRRWRISCCRWSTRRRCSSRTPTTPVRRVRTAGASVAALVAGLASPLTQVRCRL